ncbi:MAG: TetR/AcrR family transcriptional regulator [Gemmatimonadota bacterium]|nr:TetR/AcrR family transcriptional regulator [Gemmatimonadota bacterium]
MAKATLDEIADRAGVSKGTIYLYFPNKEELFRQSIRGALSSSNPAGRQTAPTTATRQLLDTLARQWDFLNSDTALTVSHLVNAEQREFPELAELYAAEVIVRFVEELEEIIERGIEQGEFGGLDPAVAARMLTALTTQSASWSNGGVAALGGNTSSPVLGEVTEFFLRAMAPEDAAFAQADGATARRGSLNN